jgi:hypothetical protein
VNKKCVSFLSATTFAPMSIQQVTFEMRAEMHLGLYVEWPLLLFDFNKKLNFSRNFGETPEYQI